MDAAGVERGVIYGVSEGGPASIVFAAMHPERTQALVLYGGMGSGVLNDLWTFDVATLKWTQQAMPAVNPGGVYLGQVAYATTTQCGYIVYGGSAAGATGVTWKLCLSAIGNQPPVASVRDRLDDGRVKIADWLGNRSVLGLEPRDAS